MWGDLALSKDAVGQGHLLAPSLQPGRAWGLQEAGTESLPEEKGKNPRHPKAPPQSRLPLLGAGPRSLQSLAPPGSWAT